MTASVHLFQGRASPCQLVSSLPALQLDHAHGNLLLGEVLRARLSDGRIGRLGGTLGPRIRSDLINVLDDLRPVLRAVYELSLAISDDTMT